MVEVKHDATNDRYIVETDAGLAVADYLIDGDTMTFTHTGVPAALEGRGIASHLIRFALEDARNRNLKVVPHCSFVRVYIDRHPEWRELLA